MRPTDAVGTLSDADVRKILLQMEMNRDLIRRLLGPAVRPIDTPAPPALLAFETAEGQKQFLARLSDHPAIRIVLPEGLAGYTIQDIGMTVVDKQRGVNNPGFLHKSFHAVLAHDARLVPGNPDHSWFHEALANYLQISMYQRSVPPGVLALNFPKGVSEDKTLFRPLRTVLGKRARPRDYVQLATLAGYLIEEKPQWLPTLAGALADLQPTEKALAACGTTLDELERSWLTWGEKRFTAATDNALRPLFEQPKEFAQ